ncbi:MAG: acetyl-CoA carboxylase biotin carboxyl carrier protein [Candidatus Limnocylindria bacterium]
MTDADDAIAAIARAASDLVPQLTERLVRHDLGEIEVSSGDLRLRVARAGSSTAAREPAGQAAAIGISPAASTPAAGAQASVDVASPAVGFFVYADGIGPGLAVEKGDALGQVEMLGIRHDVRAPRQGTVRHLVAESGEAVEYGQVVLELDAQEVAR